MRFISLIIIVLLLGCKKEDSFEPSSENVQHESCWKRIIMKGDLRDSSTNQSIDSLVIWNQSPWIFAALTDSNGEVFNPYCWDPCGKLPLHKKDSVLITVYKDQPYWGEWKVGLKDYEDGDTVSYLQYLSKSGVIELRVVDSTINGQASELLDFSMESSASWSNGSFINCNEGIDTIIYRYAIPYQTKYMAIGLGVSVFQDTTIYITPQDTVKLTFKLVD